MSRFQGKEEPESEAMCGQWTFEDKDSQEKRMAEFVVNKETAAGNRAWQGERRVWVLIRGRGRQGTRHKDREK